MGVVREESELNGLGSAAARSAASQSEVLTLTNQIDLALAFGDLKAARVAYEKLINPAGADGITWAGCDEGGCDNAQTSLAKARANALARISAAATGIRQQTTAAAAGIAMTETEAGLQPVGTSVGGASSSSLLLVVGIGLVVVGGGAFLLWKRSRKHAG